MELEVCYIYDRYIERQMEFYFKNDIARSIYKRKQYY